MLEYLFNRVADLKRESLSKKRLQYVCFPLVFEKKLRSFLQNTFGQENFSRGERGSMKKVTKNDMRIKRLPQKSGVTQIFPVYSPCNSILPSLRFDEFILMIS